jgi:hypothetical protein
MSQVLTLQEQSMFKTGNLWLFDEVEKILTSNWRKYDRQNSNKLFQTEL